MKKYSNEKIIYISYYGDSKTGRKASPAANAKLSYIFKKIKEINDDFHVLSFSLVDDRTKIFSKNPKYETCIEGIKINFFTNYCSKYRAFRVLGRFITKCEQKRFLKKILKNNPNCKVILYHSMELYWVYKYLKKVRKKFCLEVEEVYSDVLNNNKKRKKELKHIQLADYFIFPTILLNDAVNINKKPYILIHGSYELYDYNRKKKDNNIINCIYGGTFDPRKGGALAAIKSAMYLPNNYHIHILGFGSNEQINEVINCIDEINKTSDALVTYDGLLVGKEYTSFIQKCDIGLSTQNPDAKFNATSFPSKILPYMSNGLRVVSVRIPAVESSNIGKYMYYYDSQTPKNIANAIKQVDINDGYDGRKIIAELDKKFLKELRELLYE